MGTTLDKFEAGFNRFLFFLISLVALSIGMFAVGIPLNLLLIKMQWGSIWWLYEAVEYALYVGVFLGAPWVLQQNAHVKVDIIIMSLPKEAAARLEQFIDIAGAVICAVLCFYGTRAALWEFEDGTLPDKDLRIANWYMLVVFVMGFALLGIEFLFRVRRAKQIVDEDELGAGF